MSTAWAFNESQLKTALANAPQTHALFVRAFLHSEAARKLRVTPSPSPGGLSPEGAYTPTSERIA